MIVNEKIVEEIYSAAGENRLEKAREIVKEGSVLLKKIMYTNPNNFELKSKVKGNHDNYNINISVNDGEIECLECECIDYQKYYSSCKHIAATIMEFSQNPEYEMLFSTEKRKKIENEEEVEFLNKGNLKDKNTERLQREKYRVFNEIISEFFDEEKIKEEQDIKIKLIPQIIYSKYGNEFDCEFKIGDKKLYKLKDLQEFYNNMKNAEKFRYGMNLEFVHSRDVFEDKEVLEFVLKNAEVIGFINDSINRYYYKTINKSKIKLEGRKIDEFFEIYKNQKVEFLDDDFGTKGEIKLIEENPKIDFEIKEQSKNEYKITTNVNVHDFIEVEGENNIYILINNVLYKCTREFEKTNLKLLKVFSRNFVKEIVFKKEDLPNFLSIVFPKTKKSINMKTLNKNEVEKYIPLDLSTKVYLDYDKQNHITADIKFCYGEKEFNPFSDENIDVARNVVQENETLGMFIKAGFMSDVKNSRLILVEDDKIYEFLSNGIEEFMKKFEVLATEAFKEKEIRTPKVSAIGVRIESNLLNLDFSQFNFDKSELIEIMKKYRLKKKFHRLKDGRFVDLKENETMDFIESVTAGMDLDIKELEKGQIKLPMYRSLYLDRVLENLNNTQIKKDETYKNLVERVEDRENEMDVVIPNCVNANLRNYQQVGYKWLRVLDEYGLGGILADDMGLGKTLQLISVVSAYIEENENPKPSIVVCPSSLTINWYNEVLKFSKNIKVMVVNGNSETRKQKIEQIPQYNLTIISYDSLKRDIEVFNENKFKFKYIIADEAQYIKNANTQNSKAIKDLIAETRFALTGTPIENSLSELWSIFDYIMPGYLFTYKKFRDLYEMPIVKDEDTKAMRKLKMLIEPFILRRIKKEVLTELPDKVITVLNNEMEDEQAKIYEAFMKNARKEAMEQIEINGVERSQIKILALLMRLRQICCHPSLCIENYEGKSSKLMQCIEIIKDAVESGHKILLFSGYTSMFNIIEKELKKEKIEYFKLTGQTKIAERIKLVDEFNTNPDVKIFLISLKAGGTGLNLTGADMVIHYDPWWNISAENQATDRTYRIGQKKNVQVYKLITKNSIEEKIYELQKTKEKLIDSMLSAGETFINKLSKDDIMNLFS